MYFWQMPGVPLTDKMDGNVTAFAIKTWDY